MNTITFDDVIEIVRCVEMKWRWLRKDSKGRVEKLERQSAACGYAESACREIAVLIRGIRDGHVSMQQLEDEPCIDLILDQLTGRIE